MNDKPKLIAYEVPWETKGRKKILATSPEEAERLFQAMDVRDYVEEGELENFAPEVIEET